MSAGYVLAGFAAMLAMMLLGLPIAVSMAAIGLIGGLLAYGLPFINSVAPVVWGVHNDNLLTSIPLFILMGELLLRSGIADRMFGALAAWLGRLPGGLLHTNVGCSALFAATSGSSVATAATIGTVALPSLHKRGYSMTMSLGSIAAGGTLGILIPPSVNMIVYGSLTDTSIGKLFIAGIVPGLLLTGCFMLFIAGHALVTRQGIREASVPMAERIAVLKDLVPPAVVFFIVMGSLYVGVATTTESAALGVVASLAFAWKSGKLSWTLLQHCFVQTAKTSGMILLIITAAFVLNLAISLTGVAETMTQWVTSFGLSQVQLLQPFLSMLFAVPLLGERLDLGTALFAIAVVLTVFLGRKSPVNAPTNTDNHVLSSLPTKGNAS